MIPKTRSNPLTFAGPNARIYADHSLTCVLSRAAGCMETAMSLKEIKKTLATPVTSAHEDACICLMIALGCLVCAAIPPYTGERSHLFAVFAIVNLVNGWRLIRKVKQKKAGTSDASPTTERGSFQAGNVGARIPEVLSANTTSIQAAAQESISANNISGCIREPSVRS